MTKFKDYLNEALNEGLKWKPFLGNFTRQIKVFIESNFKSTKNTIYFKIKGDSKRTVWNQDTSTILGLSDKELINNSVYLYYNPAADPKSKSKDWADGMIPVGNITAITTGDAIS